MVYVVPLLLALAIVAVVMRLSRPTPDVRAAAADENTVTVTAPSISDWQPLRDAERDAHEREMAARHLGELREMEPPDGTHVIVQLAPSGGYRAARWRSGASIFGFYSPARYYLSTAGIGWGASAKRMQEYIDKDAESVRALDFDHLAKCAYRPLDHVFETREAAEAFVADLNAELAAKAIASQPTE